MHFSFVGFFYPFAMRTAMSRMQMHMSLRTVWCSLCCWMTVCSTQGHVRGRMWLKGELSRAPEARARKKLEILSEYFAKCLTNLAQMYCFTSLQLHCEIYFRRPFFPASPQLHFEIYFSQNPLLHFTSKFFLENRPFSLLHFPLHFCTPLTYWLI